MEMSKLYTLILYNWTQFVKNRNILLDEENRFVLIVSDFQYALK